MHVLSARVLYLGKGGSDRSCPQSGLGKEQVDTRRVLKVWNIKEEEQSGSVEPRSTRRQHGCAAKCKQANYAVILANIVRPASCKMTSAETKLFREKNILLFSRQNLNEPAFMNVWNLQTNGNNMKSQLLYLFILEPMACDARLDFASIMEQPDFFSAVSLELFELAVGFWEVNAVGTKAVSQLGTNSCLGNVANWRRAAPL